MPYQDNSLIKNMQNKLDQEASMSDSMMAAQSLIRQSAINKKDVLRKMKKEEEKINKKK